MAGLLSAIGGTLAGIGQGVADQAAEDGKAKREARLAELQHGYRMAEYKVQNDFTAGQNDLNRQHQSTENSLTRANTLENTRLQGANQLANTAAQGANTQANTRLTSELQGQRDERQFGRDLEKIDRTADARARARRDLYGNTSGLNADDKRQFSALDGLYGDDPEKMRQALAASGNPRLAALAQGGGSPDSSPAPKKAQMSADDKRVYDAVVERYTDPMLKKTDWGSVGRDLQAGGRDDLAAFAFGSPDPKGWEKLNVPKDLQPPTRGQGGGAPANRAQPETIANPVSQSQAPQQQQQGNRTPAGEGTTANPYTAATQADIEWFKNSAPKGAVIVVNGKPFTK